jgi:plastocyanin
MVVWWADGIKRGAKDPFRSKIDSRGKLTHGHLPENDRHGGKPRPSLPDARKLPNGPLTDNVLIQNFLYGVGDFSLPGARKRPPLVRAGQSLRFTSLDATREIPANRSAYHTITSCKAPCTGTTGIAYPLADAKVQFDSGELGFGPSGFTPAAQRNTWDTPKSLKPGTYTYFCRIHPFMRGAFRVTK